MKVEATDQLKDSKHWEAEWWRIRKEHDAAIFNLRNAYAEFDRTMIRLTNVAELFQRAIEREKIHART